MLPDDEYEDQNSAFEELLFTAKAGYALATFLLGDTTSRSSSQRPDDDDSNDSGWEPPDDYPDDPVGREGIVSVDDDPAEERSGDADDGEGVE